MRRHYSFRTVLRVSCILAIVGIGCAPASAGIPSVLGNLAVSISSLTAAASPPTVSTQAATGIGNTSATLNGSIINDGGEACQYRFRYRYLNGGWSYTSWTGSKTTGQSFNQSISGLYSGTFYYFSAQARNSSGESGWGSNFNFTTSGQATIIVHTEDATTIGSTHATLNGLLANDAGHACQVKFRFKPSGGSYIETPWIGSVTSGQSFSLGIINLSAGTTYYFSAQARSLWADIWHYSDWGDEKSFATHAAPVQRPEPSYVCRDDNYATDITAHSAVLQGVVDSDGGEACQYRFVVWKEPWTWTWPWPAASTIYTSWTGSKTTGEDFSQEVTGLERFTTYYFYPELRNSAGSSGDPPVQSDILECWHFTTEPELPKVTTTEATDVAGTSARLNGRLDDDGGVACDYRFRYRSSGGWSYPSDWTRPKKTTGEPFWETVGGLDPNTTYEFQAGAKNAAGETWGDEKKFQTLVIRPTVRTEHVTNPTDTNITLRGFITSDGGEACQYQFRCRPFAGGAWAYYPVAWTGSLRSSQPFEQYVTGLEPNTTYEFQAGAKNTAGESWSGTETFETPVIPPTISLPSATNVGPTSATLNAVLTSDGGGSCQCRFHYWDVNRKSETYETTPWVSYAGQTTPCDVMQDINDLLLPGVTYKFYAEASNTRYSSESGEAEFTTLLTPLIVSVGSSHCNTQRHAYYLDGVPFNETFTVDIDWRGLDPDRVQWITRKGTYEDACSDTTTTVSRTFDMGSAFDVGDGLTVQALATGTASPPRNANFTVIPPPLGLPAVLFKATDGKPLVEYTMTDPSDVDFFTIGVQGDAIPSDIPFFGGEGLSLVDYPSLFATVLGDGTASAGTGRGGISIPAAIGDVDILGFDLSLGGSASVCLAYLTGQWQVISGTTYMDFSMWFDTTPVYVFPGVYVLGRFTCLGAAEVEIVGWFIEGLPDLEGSFEFEPILLMVGGLGLADVVGVEVYGGGGVNVRVGFPNDDPLEKFCIVLKGGARVYFLLWEERWEVTHYWCLVDKKENAMYVLALPFQMGEALAESGQARFKPVDRDYLGPEYAVWVPIVPNETALHLMTLDQHPLTDDSVPSDEQILQSNVFGRSQPAISSDGNDILLVWVHDDPNRTDMNRTEIVFSKCTNGNWILPKVIDDDGTADFSPKLATLSSGEAFCVWENTNQPLPDTAVLEDMASAMDIGAAVYDKDTGQWTAQALVTNDYLDRSPRLSAADNGTAMVMWISNSTSDIFNPQHCAADTLQYSLWDGSQWAQPVVIAAEIGPIISASLAYNGTQAVCVYSVDTDQDWDTDIDKELYTLAYDGAHWTEPTPLTSDSVLDANPQVIYDQGDPLLVWYRDASLVSCRDLDISTLQEVLRPRGIPAGMDFLLASNPTGQISLVWTDASVKGMDIFTATYDARLAVWSKAYPLTMDGDTERLLAAAYVGPDELALSYNKVRNIIDSEGIPEPNQTDLCVLRHRIRNDLAVGPGDICFSVANPAPDSVVEITATVHNVGDLAEANVPVAFYNGDPQDKGILIGDVQIIPGPILAADTATASVSWVVPTVTEPQQVYVVVDPEYVYEDANRADNVACASVMAPDLMVAYLISETAGQNVRRITTRVANTGVLPAENVHAVIRQDSVSGPVLATFDVGRLDPNSFKDVTCDWEISDKYLDDLEVPIYAIVDEPNIVYESDETNNVRLGLVLVVNPVDVTDDF